MALERNGSGAIAMVIKVICLPAQLTLKDESVQMIGLPKKTAKNVNPYMELIQIHYLQNKIQIKIE